MAAYLAFGNVSLAPIMWMAIGSLLSYAFQEGETHGMCEWKWNKKRKKGNRHHGPYYVDRHGRCHHAPSRRSPKFATPRMKPHLKPSRVISSK
eukprot:scaffold7522_cov93-Cylindrotheca_fusiformis.AAC.1